jgi:hypothetical protein
MSQTKIPYVINLFGTALQVWELSPDPIIQQEIPRYMDAKGLGWHELLFDLELIRKFKVKHWTEIAHKMGGSELILNAEARIELRKNGRMAERIQVAELIEPTQLFAKYHVETKLLQMPRSESIYVIEQLKGQVAKFTFDSENFQIDQLQFLLIKDDLSTAPRLANIKWKQEHLHSIKEDVLLVGQQVIDMLK